MKNFDETRLPDVLRTLPAEQSAVASPVLDAPHLAGMELSGAVKTVVRNPLLPLMGAGAPKPPSGQGLMGPVPDQLAPPAALVGDPQQPKASAISSSPVSGYVRMEIHVENGKLSVAGIRHVPGPLVMPGTVIRGYAYEVLLDDQQVALGSIPDVGIRRAFANQDVAGPQGKHYFIQTPAFDFAVRIPAGYVVTATLAKLNVVLHRVEDAPDLLSNLSSLAKQPSVRTEEIGRLSGIKMEELSPDLRPQLEKIISDTEKLR